MAGTALLASVRVENKGEKDEDDVRVKVSIPSLGVSATEYIEQIDGEDEEETEEMYLRLPKCAKPGVYDVEVDVEYNEGRDSVHGKQQINVYEDPACNKVEKETATVVVAPPVQPTENTAVAQPEDKTSKVRSALEITLVVLVAVLVVIGLIMGLSRLGRDEEELE